MVHDDNWCKSRAWFKRVCGMSNCTLPGGKVVLYRVNPQQAAAPGHIQGADANTPIESLTILNTAHFSNCASIVAKLRIELATAGQPNAAGIDVNSRLRPWSFSCFVTFRGNAA